LAQFALRLPHLRPQVLTLLQRCCFDGEDDVRDRAVFALDMIRSTAEKEDCEATLAAVFRPSMSVPLDALVHSLDVYLADESSWEHPFDVQALEAALPPSAAEGASGSSSDASAGSGNAGEGAAVSLLLESASAVNVDKLGSAGDAGAGRSGEKETGKEEGGESPVSPETLAYAKKLGEELGEQLWRISTEQPLTERETEYVVTYRKVVFEKHVGFEFIVRNTIREMRLENVSVVLTPEGNNMVVEKTEAGEAAVYDEVCRTYALVKIPEGALDGEEGFEKLVGRFSCVLQYTQKDVDPETGEVSEGDTGSEEEYPLDGAEITIADYMQAKRPGGEFEAMWEGHGADNECKKGYSLGSVRGLQNGVDEVVRMLGMMPLGGSGVVGEKNKHVLIMAGRFLGLPGDVCLVKTLMMVNPQSKNGTGVMVQVLARTPSPVLSRMIASSIK